MSPPKSGTFNLHDTANLADLAWPRLEMIMTVEKALYDAFSAGYDAFKRQADVEGKVHSYLQTRERAIELLGKLAELTSQIRPKEREQGVTQREILEGKWARQQRKVDRYLAVADYCRGLIQDLSDVASGADDHTFSLEALELLLTRDEVSAARLAKVQEKEEPVDPALSKSCSCIVGPDLVLRKVDPKCPHHGDRAQQKEGQ